jgi:OOP family OmpA-OmpF porin
MSIACFKCGSSIADGQAFCICGAHHVDSSAITVPTFCTNCGAALSVGAKFCEMCGSFPLGQKEGNSQATATAAAPRLQVVASPSTAQAPGGGSVQLPKCGSPLLKFVMIVVALLVFVLLLGMGSCAYVAYRAKQKANALEQAYRRNNMNKGANERGLRNSAERGSQNSSSSSSSPSKPAAPYGWTLENGKLVPAQAPKPSTPPPPKADPVVPASATGTQNKDWALKYERTENSTEADLVVRTGDINNLGFGWPTGFDPFSGNSTPSHNWPDINKIPQGAPDGTDRIMLGSAVIPAVGDGYSGSLQACMEQKAFASSPAATSASLDAECKRELELTKPTPIVLSMGALPPKINSVLIQLFADDFQPRYTHSHFQVSLNGTRIPSLEYAINALDQSGPIGKLISVQLLPEYWPLLKSGNANLLIDDPTTHVPDGYAVDFVRILVNPHTFKYTVSLTASVLDADKHTPITGATVTAALQSAPTDARGKCQLSGLPAGLVIATAAAPGYDEGTVPVDLVSGQTGNAEIQLHRHDEGTAALEKQVAETGSATVYGIHFDTDSAKLRPDSMPALNAVLGLLNNHPASQWMIAGHTDNQGNAAHNQALSENRAASVIAWLKAHGVAAHRLGAQGFGASRPVADNSTESGRALNRRVELTAR